MIIRQTAIEYIVMSGEDQEDQPMVNGAAQLVYDDTDPWAVQFNFLADDGTITPWLTARDVILDAAQTGFAGEGADMSFRFEGEHCMVSILVGGPDRGVEACMAWMPAEFVRKFLADSLILVPLGDEVSMVDWDLELSGLLN